MCLANRPSNCTNSLLPSKLSLHLDSHFSWTPIVNGSVARTCTTRTLPFVVVVVRGHMIRATCWCNTLHTATVEVDNALALHCATWSRPGDKLIILFVSIRIVVVIIATNQSISIWHGKHSHSKSADWSKWWNDRPQSQWSSVLPFPHFEGASNEHREWKVSHSFCAVWLWPFCKHVMLPPNHCSLHFTKHFTQTTLLKQHLSHVCLTILLQYFEIENWLLSSCSSIKLLHRRKRAERVATMVDSQPGGGHGIGTGSSIGHPLATPGWTLALAQRFFLRPFDHGQCGNKSILFPMRSQELLWFCKGNQWVNSEQLHWVWFRLISAKMINSIGLLAQDQHWISVLEHHQTKDSANSVGLEDWNCVEQLLGILCSLPQFYFPSSRSIGVHSVAQRVDEGWVRVDS